jgi:hypothetical protein
MKTFQFNFNEQQLKVLNDALIEMPFKISAPLIQHINSEIQKTFDKSVDESIPSGQTILPDPYSGD